MKRFMAWDSLSKKTYLSMVLIVIAFSFSCIYSLYELRHAIIESRKYEISSVLAMAKHQSSEIIHQAQEGLISREDAEKKVVDFLSGLRDGKYRYVWANDDNAFARVHVREGIIGTFQKSYTRDMAWLLTDDPYFNVTTNVKPVDNVRVIKINGITKLPEWNWVVGFGIYMDDSDAKFWVYGSRIVTAYFILGGCCTIIIGLFGWKWKDRFM